MDKLFFIQPWENNDEFIYCYELLFSHCQKGKNLRSFLSTLDNGNIKKAIRLLAIWEKRNDNKAFTLTTLLLLDAMLKISTLNSLLHFAPLDISHILSETLIRCTNLIIDELKKTKKTTKANMSLVAKEIGLPTYIVDLRHACTHKNLPSVESLTQAIQILLMWVKENMWDNMYATLIKEKEIYNKLVGMISNDKFVDKELEDSRVLLEVEHIMNIIVQLFSKVILQKKKKNTVKSVLNYIYITQRNLTYLLIWQFVVEQVEILCGANSEGESDHDEKYNCLLTYLTISSEGVDTEEFDLKTYRNLFIMINTRLRMLKKISVDKGEGIYKLFVKTFPKLDVEENLMTEDELRLHRGLYKTPEMVKEEGTKDGSVEVGPSIGPSIEVPYPANESEYYSTLII